MARLGTVAMLLGLLLAAVLPAGRAGAAGTRQGTLPRGWKRLVWQGVVINYDPKAYRFEERKPDDALARAQARLIQSPDPCTADGADCGPGEVTFRLYPGSTGDARGWVARNMGRVYAGSIDDFTDALIGGRQAVRFVGELGVGGALTSYVAPTGSDMLLMTTFGADERIVSLLQFSRPSADRLAVGHVAMTKPERVWNLWTAPVGGARVYERPRLVGGTLVTIRAVRPNAVQVRTTDGVTGWIRAPITTALTTQSVLIGEHTRVPHDGARVVLRNGIALRAAPRSTAPRVATFPRDVDRLPSGQRLIVLGRRGDWLRVVVNEIEVNGTGWVRWHYDGVRYVVASTN